MDPLFLAFGILGRPKTSKKTTHYRRSFSLFLVLSEACLMEEEDEDWLKGRSSPWVPREKIREKETGAFGWKEKCRAMEDKTVKKFEVQKLRVCFQKRK